MTISDLLFAPFSDDAMHKALAACLILSIGATPVGVFMTMRRMALLGDAMSHAMLPGVSLAFLLYGLSTLPMTLAALVTGILIALCAFALTRATKLQEDAGFTIVYLMSLSFGVIMASYAGTDDEIMHILFGDEIRVDNASIIIAATAACFSVSCLCVFFRSFVIECLDPDFMRAARGGINFTGTLFFVLVIASLVASFQILGTLMALGLMILPAVASRFWAGRIDTVIGLAVVLAALSSFAGLLISAHADLPAGPCVVLSAGCVCVFSALFGKRGSVLAGRTA